MGHALAPGCRQNAAALKLVDGDSAAIADGGILRGHPPEGKGRVGADEGELVGIVFLFAGGIDDGGLDIFLKKPLF